MRIAVNHQSSVFRLSIVLLLASCFLFLSLIKPVFAQENSTLTPLPANITTSSPVYTDLIVSNLFHTFNCMATGSSPTGEPCLTYKFTTDAQGITKSIPMLSSTNLSGGMLGVSTSLIAGLYESRPVSTGEYMAYLGQNLGLVKEAKAQVSGSGDSVLSPLLALWRASRNIAYVMIIIVLLIIGLMVMFRNKLNPQTIISAQAALPGIVIGLILITFSYFLAALITDMAFVGTNIVGYYFSLARGDANPQNLVEVLSKENAITLFGKFDFLDSTKVTDLVDSIWGGLSGWATFALRALTTFALGSIANQVTAPFAAIPNAGPVVAGAGQLLALLKANVTASQTVSEFAYLVAAGMLIYAMFTLLYRLLKVYLTIIFLVITAPFHFLIAALPGRQGIATGWIFNLLGNVLVFPAVIAVFYFAVFITGKPVGPLTVSDGGYSNNYQDSMIKSVFAADTGHVASNNSLPLLGGINLEFMQMLLALVALVASTAIPDLVVKAVGKAGQAGQVIGQEFTGAIGKSQGYLKQMQGGIGQNVEQMKDTIYGKKTPVYNPDTKKFELKDTGQSIIGVAPKIWGGIKSGISDLRSGGVKHGPTDI